MEVYSDSKYVCRTLRELNMRRCTEGGSHVEDWREIGNHAHKVIAVRWV